MGTLDDEILAGRYRLGPLLGRGGMADVHQGLDLRLDRAVAIKLLRPEMAAHPEVRRRFEEEARSAARLSHPHAVAVYDTGEDRGTPFIVMEQLPGETLADRIGQGPLGEDWVLGVAHDVLGALDAAHAAGLVHRDVKPANILIDAEGRAKVADFGIAKSVEVVGGQLDLTATDVLVGTPAYLAPERLNGEPASAQSDIWASGAVLFEALAGAKPFPGATPLAMVSAIQAGAPLSLRQLRPQVSPRTAGAVERAMAARPEDRYPTAAAMAEALGVLHLADGRRRAVEPGAVAVAGAAVAGAEATLVKAHGDEPAAQAGPDSVWDDSDTRIDPRGALDPGSRGVAGLGAHRARLLLTAAAVLLAV